MGAKEFNEWIQMVVGLPIFLAVLFGIVYTVGYLIGCVYRAFSYVAERRHKTSPIILQLLKLTLTPEHETDNIAGDLLEEFNEFPSRLYAHLWLYNQVLKSALPLAYKSLKSRLASYFGERVR